MPLRQLKKIPSKPTKDTPPGELFAAKTGSDVRYGINLDGVIYEVSLTPKSSAPSSGGSGGTSDHGALSGLSDDDHAQYHNDARGDARYPLKSLLTTKGDLYVRDGSAVNRLAIGSDGQLLIPDTSNTVGMKWSNLIFNNDELISNNDEIVTI